MPLIPNLVDDNKADWPVVTTRVHTSGARGGRRREKDNEEQKNGQLNPSRGKKGRHEEQKNGQLDGDEVS